VQFSFRVHTLCTLALGTFAVAQRLEPVPSVRTPVPDATPQAAADAQQPNTSVVAIVGATHLDIDDEPDFTPVRQRDDGAADVTRDIAGDHYVLAFPGVTIKPEPGIDPRLLAAMPNNPAGHTYGYIMIQGRLNHPRKVAQLQALGIEIYAPHTWQSFAAKIPFAAIAGLRSLPFVRWVGYADPMQKIDPLLIPALARAVPGERFAVHVSTFDTDVNPASEWRTVGAENPNQDRGRAIDLPLRTLIPNGPYHRALVALGFEFKHYADTGGVHYFTGNASVEQITRMRELDFIAYIEPEQRHTMAHDQSQMMISADRVRGTYHGETVTVGVIDSGIDSTPWHNDFGGKAFVGWRTGGTTAFNDDCEHGTHVSGTIFGGGIAQARYRGTAPNCGNGGAGGRVFIGRYFFDACEPLGTVADLYTAFSSNYVEGTITNPRPRCINNSWGAAPAGTWIGSEAGARTLDDVIQNNLQLYVFAAGNSGGGVGSPGSAKNALTVGSLDDFGTAAGDASSFSRSGVTDGRQKPEVSAPGQWVTSCDAGTTTGYVNFNGTSMAAPHVTGALTGLIHHYSFLDYSPPAQSVVSIASSEVNGQPNLNTVQGWGCINAYKMHWTSKTGWSVITNHTHIDTTGEWFFGDIAVPAGIVSMDVVWGWTEPAAAAGAAAARRSSIRITLDAPPYAAAGDAGEYTAFLGVNNKWKVANVPIAAFAGQTVRVKLYGISVSGLCRVSGLLFYHYDNTATPEATLNIARSDDCVQPNTTFTMTGTWSSPAAADEFDNSRIWPVVPSFTVTQLLRNTADGVAQTYVDATHTSSPWPSLGANGITTGQGTSRPAIWTLRAPAASNTYTLRVDGQADFRTTATATASTSICVDGLIPNLPTGLSSSTHTANVWSNNNSITFNWTPGTDNGCAGVASQQYARGNNSCPTPSTSTAAGTNTRIEAGLASVTSGNGYFFAVRSIDNCGNIGNSGCVGPFLIDTVVPVVTSATINGGAALTTSLNVTVANVSSDAHSGLNEIRYSSDNATWSAWAPYAASSPYNLSSNGGNTNEGTKTVYVQVRDRAGNISSTGSDTIEYRRLPAIAMSTPASLPNVTENFFRLTGTDLGDVVEVRFDGAPITTTSPDNWHVGYFRIINDTTLDVYPPQAQPTGAHTLQVRNPAGLSNIQNVSLAFPASAVLRTHSTLTAGRPQTIFTSSGPVGGAFVSFLTLSPSNAPSILPGIISLEIGNSFSSLTLLSIPFAHNAITRAATIGPFGTNASMIGATLFFEGITFLVPAFPLPTTDSWRTVYN
jgi:hypothetical protein